MGRKSVSTRLESASSIFSGRSRVWKVLGLRSYEPVWRGGLAGPNGLTGPLNGLTGLYDGPSGHCGLTMKSGTVGLGMVTVFRLHRDGKVAEELASRPIVG